MKHYVSFTSILMALHNNRLTFEELQTPDALLAFGCSYEYVTDDAIPTEVTCLQYTRRTHQGSRVSQDRAINCTKNIMNLEKR